MTMGNECNAFFSVILNEMKNLISQTVIVNLKSSLEILRCAQNDRRLTCCVDEVDEGLGFDGSAADEDAGDFIMGSEVSNVGRGDGTAVEDGKMGFNQLASFLDNFNGIGGSVGMAGADGEGGFVGQYQIVGIVHD